MSSFLDGITYLDDADGIIPFTQDRLLRITDEDVANYLRLKAFGTPTPAFDACPIYCRSDTLYYHKKALSQFMPRRSMKWDDVSKIGNPTMSEAVNKVIDLVCEKA